MTLTATSSAGPRNDQPSTQSPAPSRKPAPFWPQYTPASGINYRHIDTDGDGLISAADTLALSQNWGLAWEDGEGRPGSPPFQTNADGAPFYLQPDTLIEGATMQLPLILGSEETPAAGVYGLAFSLYFDEAVVQDGSAALLLADSWLGNPAQNLIYMQRLDDAAGRIDVGITRIDGLDAEGYGPIGDLFITIEDDILALNRGFGREAWFEIRNARLISYQEEPLAVDTPPSVSPVLTSLRDQPLSLKLRLSPNPAGDETQLVIHSQTALGPCQLQLIDAQGRILQERSIDINNGTQQFPLLLTELPAGQYWVRLRQGTRQVSRGVIKG